MADAIQVRPEIQEFLDTVPELQPAWDEHLRCWGEPLLTIFFEEAVCPLAVRAARGEGNLLHRHLLTGLEALASSGDEALENLIFVSFIEYLAWGDEGEQEALRALAPSFGPAMRARLHDFNVWDESVTPRDHPPKDTTRSNRKRKRKGGGPRRKLGRRT